MEKNILDLITELQSLRIKIIKAIRLRLAILGIITIGVSWYFNLALGILLGTVLLLGVAAIHYYSISMKLSNSVKLAETSIELLSRDNILIDEIKTQFNQDMPNGKFINYLYNQILSLEGRLIAANYMESKGWDWKKYKEV